MRLHLKGNTFYNNEIFCILKKIMMDCCYDGRETKILSFIKLGKENDLAFITLTLEEAYDNLLNNGLSYNPDELNVNITKDNELISSHTMEVWMARNPTTLPSTLHKLPYEKQ